MTAINWRYWADMNDVRLLDPMMANPNDMAEGIAGALAVLAFLSYRPWNQIVFGLAWISVTAMATLISGPSDRSFHIPSIGLCFVLGALASWLLARRNEIVCGAAFGGVMLLVLAYGTALYQLNQVYHRAGEITQAIPAQVIAQHPTFPEDSRLVFTGVPDTTREGVLVFMTGFPCLLNSAYPLSNFTTLGSSKFPIWQDKLDRTFLFRVDHRKVTERPDLVCLLRQRSYCSNYLVPAVEWDFQKDSQGWESRNELGDFRALDGELRALSKGNDPIMARPSIRISSIAIGVVEITMSVHSATPLLNGRLYWKATGQHDFSPEL